MPQIERERSGTGNLEIWSGSFTMYVPPRSNLVCKVYGRNFTPFPASRDTATMWGSANIPIPPAGGLKSEIYSCFIELREPSLHIELKLRLLFESLTSQYEGRTVSSVTQEPHIAQARVGSGEQYARQMLREPDPKYRARRKRG
jgi:hypothetical protein